MKYNIKREQQINSDIETVWDFFSSPLNLSAISPDDMNFKILTDFKNKKIEPGMRINYLVSPLFGIPLKWQTLITYVEKHKSFTDFQEKGPYKFWNHYHEFIPNEKGVLVRDNVDYELPFGAFGTIMHKLVVKKKLEEIFDYRFRVLNELFNTD